jgi:hypothetical protein
MTTKPETLKASLESYVKTHRPRGICAVCQLGEVRDMMDEQARNGTHQGVLHRWLTTEGGHPEITYSNMTHHYQRNRHYEVQS